jgi:hypothetical protein
MGAFYHTPFMENNMNYVQSFTFLNKLSIRTDKFMSYKQFHYFAEVSNVLRNRLLVIKTNLLSENPGYGHNKYYIHN